MLFKWRNALRLAALLAVACCVWGCSSQNHFGVIAAGRNGMTDYDVGGLSADWEGQRVADADHVFIHDPSGCSILVNSTCGIDNRIPLVALTNHLLIDFTHREIVRQEELALDGRTALRTELGARLDGAPIALCIYVVQIDSCIYELIFAAHPDDYAAHLVEFEEFVTEFHARRGD